MKKILAISGICCFFTLKGAAQSTLYEYSLQDAKDSVINMESFRGKKLLLLLLPKVVSPSLIDQIRVVQRRNVGSLYLVGFLAPGTSSESLVLLQDSLTGFVPNIYLSPLPEGQGNSPAALKWLIDAKNNRSLLKATATPGYAFLVNEYGKVLHVLPPSEAITSPFLQRIIDFISPSDDNK